MSDRVKRKVPGIRFKGFEGEWERFQVNQIGEVITGNTPSKSDAKNYGGDILWATAEDFSEKYIVNTKLKLTKQGASKARILPQGSVLVTCIASIGKNAIAHNNMGTNQQINGVIVNFSHNNEFFYHQISLNTNKLLLLAGVTAVPIVNKSTFECVEVLMPSLPEQIQIGNFFKLLDASLNQHQTKLEKLQSLKQAMLQKMFPQGDARVPEIRFEGFEGEWEERELGEISKKITEKNLSRQYKETFTNSAEFGVISQSQFFDKSISNVHNIGSYYIVEDNDFVYNPRISSFAPCGPINRNKLKRTGVISPLYTIFRTVGVDLGYLDYFFITNLWHPYMYFNGDTGARSDRFSIKDSVFFSMPIICPPTKHEQQKIGTYFRKLDELIALERTQLDKLKQIKEACLSGMFV